MNNQFIIRFSQEDNWSAPSDGFNIDEIAIYNPDELTTTVSFTQPSCNGDSDGSATITSTTGGSSRYAYHWPEAQAVSGVTPVGSLLSSTNGSILITGTNRLLIATYYTRTPTPQTSPSMLQYGGVQMHFLKRAYVGTSVLETFYLNDAEISSAVGTNFSLWVNDANYEGVMLHASILENVDQDNPFGRVFTNTETTNNTTIELTGQDFRIGEFHYLAVSAGDDGSSVTNLPGYSQLTYESTNDMGPGGGGSDDGVMETQGFQVTTTYTSATTNITFSNNENEKILVSAVIYPEASTINNLSAGVYQVTTTDIKLDYTTTTNVTVTEPDLVNVTLTPTDYNGVEVSCNAGADGIISTNVTGGTIATDYTYNWSASTSSQTTANATGLSAGIHAVTVEDDNGCTGNATITLNEPTILTTTPSVTSGYNGEDVSCFGASDGQIAANAANGTAPYSYTWNTAALNSTGASVVGLPAGTNYVVTVTDANGCTSSNSVTITEPTALGITTTLNSSVSCNGGNNGQITAISSGGTGAITYSWSTNANTQSPTSGVATALAAGAYSATVQDANGCQTGSSPAITVIEPASIAVAGVTVTNVSCNAGNNGAINIDVTGGNGGYTYTWTGGATSEDISSLTQGVYDVTISDATLCSITSTFTVTEPAVLSPTLLTTISEVCFGDSNGSIDIDVTGGTTPYAYVWDDGGSSTSQDLSSLTGNTYTVTVSDFLSCTATLPVIVQGSSALLNLSSTTVTTITCNGASTGAIDLTTADGTAPYTYVWDDPSSTSTEDISSLIAGTYAMTVTDALGCSTTISETVVEDAGMTLTPTIEDITDCSSTDGNITITPSGGYGAVYDYLWNTTATTQAINVIAAGIYTVTVTDVASTTLTSDAATCSSVYVSTVTSQNGITVTTASTSVTCNGGTDGTASVISNPNTSSIYIWDVAAGAQTTATATGLSAGSYTATVTDNNCKEIRTITVVEPSSISISDVITNPLCFGGTDGEINVTATGGIVGTGYSYTWTGTNVSPTTEDQTGLSDGTYNVTVMDGNGCTTSSSITLTEPASIGVVATETTSITCNGASTGVITATPSGGTTPYSFAWGASAGAQSSSSGLATGLTAGTYSVTLTDGNNCSSTTSQAVTEPGSAVGAVPSISAAISCNSGNDGEITLTPSGGTPGYTYNWSGNAGVQSGATGIATGLSTGTYTATVTDGNACIVTVSQAVGEPTPIDANISINLINGADVSCTGGTDGSATATPSGGTAGTGYSYLWSTTPNQTTATATGLFAGPIFKLTVTDGNACATVETINLTNPPILTLTGSVSSNFNGEDVSCSGSTDGEGIAALSGGTVGSGYTYTWNTAPIQNTATVTGLGNGSYRVTATDGNGCQLIETINISDPNQLAIVASTSISYNGEDVSCSGATDGAVQTTITQTGTFGTGYSYIWSNGSTTANISGVTAASYSDTVTDGNGCTAAATYTLTEPSAITISTSITSSYGAGGFETSCSYSSDGAAIAAGSGGTVTTGYSYSWSNTETTAATSANLSPGAHSVTVTDNNGCSSSTNITVSPAPVIVSGETQTNVSIAGSSTGQASLAPTGGQSGYTYLWTQVPGVITAANEANSGITNMPAGTYSMTITDANGCDLPVNFTITENSALDGGTIQHADASGAILNVCENDNVVTNITNQLGASGGAGGYTYAWEYSTDFLNWSPIPGSITTTDFTGNLTVTQTQVVRRVATDAASAVAYSNSMILLSVDTTTTLSFIPSSFCDNDGQPQDLLVSPSNVSTTWVFNDLITPGNTTLATNGDGTGDFTPSDYIPGNQSITHIYTNGDGCVSTLVTTVTINSPTTASFSGTTPTIFSIGSDPAVVLDSYVSPFNSSTDSSYFDTNVQGVSYNGGQWEYQPTVAGTHTIEYVYLNSFGCTDTTTHDIVAQTNVASIELNGNTDGTIGTHLCMSNPTFDIEGLPNGTNGSYAGPRNTIEVTYGLSNTLLATSNSNTLSIPSFIYD